MPSLDFAKHRVVHLNGERVSDSETLNVGEEDMNNTTYDAKLAELEAKIAALPADQQALLAPLLAETQHRHVEIKKNVAAARDALDDWRIAMKYMVFDLEAQAREAHQH